MIAQARLKERVWLKRRSKAKTAAAVVSKKVPSSFLPVPDQGEAKSGVGYSYRKSQEKNSFDKNKKKNLN